MDHYHKYIKYKTKYFALKYQSNDLVGGMYEKKILKQAETKIDEQTEKIRNIWQAEIKERKKELENMKNTKSFVPFDKLSSKNKEYYIHDNGGRPYKVIANQNGINIYSISAQSLQENISEDELAIYDKHVMSIKDFIGYWSGFDSSTSIMHGNSILVQSNKNNYIYIGPVIYRFKTDDIIYDYVSPVGNNDVPYPVAFGNDNVYFFLDNQFIKRNDLETPVIVANAEDLYAEFYGYIGSKKGKYPKYDMENVKILAHWR